MSTQRSYIRAHEGNSQVLWLLLFMVLKLDSL